MLGDFEQLRLGKARPWFQRAKSFSHARFASANLTELPTGELEDLHEEGVEALLQDEACDESSGAVSLLDVKIELCRRYLAPCILCPRLCLVDRNRGERGFCGLTAEARWFKEALLWAEESPLVPSHEVFLTGCDFRCVYCYSWRQIENVELGRPLHAAEFAEIIERRHAEGANNLNLLGGEPTVNLLGILQLLKEVSVDIPIVWNTNFYATPEAMSLLRGLVDVYLADCRAGNPECAQKLSGVRDLEEVFFRNLPRAAETADVILRHLVIPGHVDCCLQPILKRAAREASEIPVHVMTQYLPDYKAGQISGLDRTVSSAERERVDQIIAASGVRVYREEDRPTPRAMHDDEAFETEITVLPDGRVCFKHLTAELLEVADILTGEEEV